MTPVPLSSLAPGSVVVSEHGVHGVKLANGSIALLRRVAGLLALSSLTQAWDIDAGSVVQFAMHGDTLVTPIALPDITAALAKLDEAEAALSVLVTVGAGNVRAILHDDFDPTETRHGEMVTSAIEEALR